MSPQLWLIAGIVYLVSVIGAGSFGFSQGINHEKAKELEELVTAIQEKDKAQDQVNKVSEGYEQIVAFMNQQQKDSERKWRSELNKPVYRNCKPDFDGLLQLNSQIDAANSTRKLNGTMPPGLKAPTRDNAGGFDGRAPSPGVRLQ